MAVSLLAKRKEKKKFKISRELIREQRPVIFALGIFLTALIVYGGTSFYTKKLSGKIELMRSEAERIESERDIESENKVLAFDKKLTATRSLLDSHVKSSNLFAFIENITHPSVYFINFTFRANDGTVVLNGSTENYITFGEQYIALQENENISDLRLSKVGLSKTGNVEFGLSFKVDNFFYK